VSEFAWTSLSSSSLVLTCYPALLLYPEIVASNVERTLELWAADANRWLCTSRPLKLGYTLRMLVEHGIRISNARPLSKLAYGCRSGAEMYLSLIQRWAPMCGGSGK